MRRERSNAAAEESETEVLAPASPRVEPTTYGSAPIEIVLVLVLAGLVIGIWLLLTSHVYVGLVVALLAVALAVVLAAEIVETLLGGRLARGVGRAAGEVQRRAALSRVALSESFSALLEVVRLKLDHRRLARRFDRLTRELGEAVYSGNPALAEIVKDEAHETAAELRAADEERERVLRFVRTRIGRQRAAAGERPVATDRGRAG